MSPSTSSLSTTNPTSPRMWRAVRWAVVLLGVLLPYFASAAHPIPYWQRDVPAQLMVCALHAVLWLPLWGLTWLYRFAAAMAPPAVLGLGFALWAQVSVEMSNDAQAGLAAVLIPLLALVPLAVGALMGWGLDRRWRRQAAVQPAVHQRP